MTSAILIENEHTTPILDSPTRAPSSASLTVHTSSSPSHLAEQWEKLLTGTTTTKPIINQNKPNGLLLSGVDKGTTKLPLIVAAAGLGSPPQCQQLPVPRLEVNRRLSTSSILGSFQRSFRLSIGSGGGGDGAGRGHVFSRYRQSRFNARRIRKRVVFKHGDCNVTQGNVSKRSRKYLQDIFTTLVDAQWRWTLLVFALNFLLSWLAFATMWFMIAYVHGDLAQEHMNNSTWTPCITNVNGFTSCFLFSVETQHTIGYGGRTTTEECPVAIIVMCMQSITGVMIQAFMVGVVFTKLSRPKKRTQTLLFSRNAVICHRDGVPSLMFRVGDMRKSHIIEAHVRAQLIKHKVTKEGEHLPFYQTELPVGGDGIEDKIFFIWPTTIVHKIDKYSPLYHMTATDLLRERFEIVVVLEGIIESTGMTTQARSSYLPGEILWGHRFESLITFRKGTGEYEVDYGLFNNTTEVDTPLCCARQLDEERGVVLDTPGGLLRSSSGHPTTRSASSETICSLEDSSFDDHLPPHQRTALNPPLIPPVHITLPQDSNAEDAHAHLTSYDEDDIDEEDEEVHLGDEDVERGGGNTGRSPLLQKIGLIGEVVKQKTL